MLLFFLKKRKGGGGSDYSAKTELEKTIGSHVSGVSPESCCGGISLFPPVLVERKFRFQSGDGGELQPPSVPV